MILAKHENWTAGNSNINPKKLANDNLGVYAENLDTRHADFRGLPAADSVHTLDDGAAPLLSMRYFSIDVGVETEDDIPAGDQVVARTAFLAALTDYEVETCEGLVDLTNDPTLTFGAITCTTVGFKAVSDPTDTRPAGRANTTTGGTKFIESRSITSELPAPIPTSKLIFSEPVAAFGAYFTDIADFYSQLRVWVNMTDGTRRCMNVPIVNVSAVDEGSVAFFGFILAGDGEFNSIEFARDDNFCFADIEFGEYINENTDQFGLDDIIVATAAQVNLTEVGHPYPWNPGWGYENMLRLSFNELQSGQVNEFPNIGSLADLIYEPDGWRVVVGVDSAANSTTAGTWVTETGFDGKCYACIGERVSLDFPALLQAPHVYLFAGGLTVEFDFKRSGARVGTGEIIHIPNLLSVRCDASHNIELALTATEAGPTTLNYTLTSSTSVATGSKKHVRVMVHAVDQGANIYAIRGAIFIDGVMVADSTWFWSTGVTRLGTGTMGPMQIGGKDGSNYTPGFIDEVSLANTIRNQFVDFTPPSAPMKEIYPPGMFPVSGSGGGGGGGGGDPLAQQNWIYRMGRETPSDTEFWLSSENDGDAARWPLASDPNERTVITGAMFDIPSYTDSTFLGAPPYPTGGYDLGIPAPADTFTLAIATAGTGNVETRAYVVTFLRYNGDEGPPSLPKYINVPAGSTVTIGSLPAVPSGNNSGITGRRVHVTTGIDYRRIAQVLIAATSATDLNVLGPVLQTGGSETKPDWVPPPDTGKGIIELWAGMLGMFDGKQYMTSVPFNPHGWPIKFRRPVPDTIVGTAKWGQQWLLATTGIPRVVTGTTPLAMIDTPIYSSHACVSKRSVVGVGHGVCWASSKGLCYHGQLGTKMLTEDILTKEEWRALNPESMIGAHWGKWYMCFFDDGTKRGLMIDTRDPQGVIYLTQGAFAIFNDPINSELYLLDTGNVIRKWDSGEPQDAIYKSKNYRLSRGTNPGAGRIVGTTYPITFDFWIDGAQVVTDRVISNDNGFRLPSGSTPEEIQFRWRGKGPAEMMLIGEEMVDL